MARPVGINHVALEVGDVEQAVAFYRRIFDFEMRGRVPGMAFLDMGDQFLALSEGREGAADAHRHFGVVVDDRTEVRRRLEAAGTQAMPGRGFAFRDPWGNQVEVVQYDEVQFTKAPEVLRGMRLEGLRKTPEALAELRGKGLAG